MPKQTNRTPRREALLGELVHEAGEILLKHFGRLVNVRQKESPCSVVSDADLAAEACITKRLRSEFPEDAIIAEESGYVPGSSGYTWVIDPLDGTSNFVAGLPWFGVQIGIFQKQKPVAAAMFLPIEKTFYFARAGRGVFKNGKTVRVTRETKLRNVLCAFGFDAAAEDRRRRKMISLLMRVSGGVRNTRATNSLVDFCHTLEGRFGGCINLNCKIWDIVPVAVMLPEAGGRLTDIGGKPLRFDLGETSCERVYAILGASKALHPRLLALTRSATLKA